MHCKTCNTNKVQDDFYASNKTRCKECIKASVRANRLENIDHYRAFDKARASMPHRVAARAKYANTIAGMAAHKAAREKYDKTNPNSISAKKRYALSDRGIERKRIWCKSESGKTSARKNTVSQRMLRPDRNRARTALGNAVRDRRVIPWPVCAIPECDDKPQAHHPDYDRPLDVVWLCQSHHKQAHALI